MINSLSGRFLILSIVFVMLAEVLIFVPSVARFRQDYLMARIEKAQIASLAVQASERHEVAPELAQQLLDGAEVYNIVLRQDASQLLQTTPIPGEITTMVDLRKPSPLYLVGGALMQLAMPADGVIRVLGTPTIVDGKLIEVTLPQAPLHSAMIDYGLRILWLSLVISVVSAAFLFLAVRRLMVHPIKNVVRNMQLYSEAPEDVRRILKPSSSINELHAAEKALSGLQTQLSSSLKQKERLAQLGGAVAKISHDLRNILTTATLLADRMEMSEDPAVKRSAPKLVNSLSRAVNLCEGTLAFGRVDEAPPKLDLCALNEIVDDVIESESLAASGTVSFEEDVAPNLTLRCDKEQLFRVLGNLLRNARQAIEATGKPGTITISAGEDDDEWRVCVTDTGPGLPPKAKEHLFTAFEGGVRKGGTGLGLVIASELMRGHGGKLDLTRSDASGTSFTLHLPKHAEAFERAAE